VLGRIHSLLVFSLNTDNFEGHLQNLFGHGKVILWMSLGADWEIFLRHFMKLQDLIFRPEETFSDLIFQSQSV